MKLRAFVFLIAAACATVSLAKEPKTLGKVTDPDALAKVKSYCIDTSKGSPAEIAEVKKFADEETDPKKSLGRLGWTRAEDCSQADALMRFGFQQTTKVEQAGNSVEVQTSNNVPVDAYVATLIVSDRASGRPLYQVKGEETESARYRSMVNAVQKLTKDLKKLSG